MQEIAVLKVGCSHEKGLQTLFGAGNDCSVITKKQTSYNGNEDYPQKIALAACLIIDNSHILRLDVEIHDSLVELLAARFCNRLALGLGVLHNLLKSEFAILKVLAYAAVVRGVALLEHGRDL